VPLKLSGDSMLRHVEAECVYGSPVVEILCGADGATERNSFIHSFIKISEMVINSDDKVIISDNKGDELKRAC